VIWWPFNDFDCLTGITRYMVANLARPDVVALARRFRSTAQLAEWLRDLPQRNDDGDERDGPRLQCDVSQRVRIAPADPNCVERALTYIILAEHIDPRPLRQLATIDTPLGRHTLPVENGEAVILDPRQQPAQLGAQFLALRNLTVRGPLPPRVGLAWPLDGLARSVDDLGGLSYLQDLLAWICEAAEGPAFRVGADEGVATVELARRTLEDLHLATPRIHRANLRRSDVATLTAEGLRVADTPAAVRAQVALVWTLVMADEGAAVWGAAGAEAVDVARSALDRLGLLTTPERFLLALHTAPQVGSRIYEALAARPFRNAAGEPVSTITVISSRPMEVPFTPYRPPLELLDPYPTAPRAPVDTRAPLNPYPTAPRAPSPSIPLDHSPPPASAPSSPPTSLPTFTPSTTALPPGWRDPWAPLLPSTTPPKMPIPTGFTKDGDPEQEALWAGFAQVERLKRERAELDRAIELADRMRAERLRARPRAACGSACTVDRRNWGDRKEDWWPVMQVLHGIGKGVLGALGAGSIADLVEAAHKKIGALPPDPQPPPPTTTTTRATSGSSSTTTARNFPYLPSATAQMARAPFFASELLADLRGG
jgi:hypothetical protein